MQSLTKLDQANCFDMFAQCKLLLPIANHKVKFLNSAWTSFAGPTWHKSTHGPILHSSLPYDGSRSRNTNWSLADTLECNIWRRAQTPHMFTYCLHGGAEQWRGFTALGTTIGTLNSTEKDSEYVTEHQVHKIFQKKLVYYVHSISPFLRGFPPFSPLFLLSESRLFSPILESSPLQNYISERSKQHNARSLCPDERPRGTASR